MAETILFYIFAIGVLFSGAQVVMRRNPVHGALSLVACFFFLAGTYVLLAAHLIAILQIMVYAGAVMVLFVFVIMLLNLKEEELGNNGVGDFVVNGRTDEDDAVLEQARIDVPRAFGAAIAFVDVGNDVAHRKNLLVKTITRRA